MLALGYRMASYIASFASFLPISERLGPTSLPSPLTTWQFAHVPTFAKSSRPWLALPFNFTRALIAGIRALSFAVGNGNNLSANAFTSFHADWCRAALAP